ncbi:MAG: aspartyl/asparaginyl beta-hydroxylase domain-containing protein [Sphingomonas sp.]|nr:aspartyl/asparaginyl beta-hydroxylase domain-containing protein [Sphingomonas sp.]
MFDIPGQPILDKTSLVGGCVRLPLELDVERLRGEVAGLPADLWGTRGGRVGVHSAAEALFLRGFAPAEGDLPVEDRPALDRLPYIRSILGTIVPAPPLRALLAKLPAGAEINPHVDMAPYFSKSLRIHIPIETNEAVWMFSSGLGYRMRPGEIWALNNSAEHAVWNRHPSLPRTHLIADFLPTPELADLLAEGERDLGLPISEVEAVARVH